MTRACHLRTIFEHCVYFAIMKDPFKCLLLLSGFKELCQTDICCRILGMLQASDSITLENLANESRKLKIKCDNGMNQQDLVRTNMLMEVPMKLPENVSSLWKTLTECWICNDLHFAPLCSYKSHIYKLCGERGHKETMY